MLTRRRFIEATAATTVAGSAIGITQDALAATSGSTFSSSSWLALQGERVGLLDSAGNLAHLRVRSVRIEPAQPNTTGEAFLVSLTGGSVPVPDGIYRLRGGITGRVFLVESGQGGAVLTVNTVRAR